MHERLEKKLDKLRKSIRDMDSVLVRYSGGIDSAFLLRICREELGEKAVAVTTISGSYPKDELDIAEHVARIIGIRHITVKHKDILAAFEDAEDIHFALQELAASLDLKNVLDSSHKGDSKSKDHKAAKRAGLRSPLHECGFTKPEIKMLADYLGVPHTRTIKSKKKSKRKPGKKSKKKKSNSSYR